MTNVPDDDDPERVRRIAEAPGEDLAPRLVPDVRLHGQRVGGGTRHHDLDRAPVVTVAVPLRSEDDDLAVELDGDAPAHADDHRLAVHRLEPLLEVRDKVGSNQAHAPVGPDHGLEGRFRHARRDSRHQVDGVSMAPKRGQDSVQRFHHIRAQLGQFQTASGHLVGHQDAPTAAHGEHGDPFAPGQRQVRQREGQGHELVGIGGDDHPRLMSRSPKNSGR